MNHEQLRVFRRMGIVAGQWRLGHFLPVWSTTAFHGYGSPSPIIYHKVFNLLSTLFWLLTGAPKTAICLALLAASATAFLGAAQACRAMLSRADLAIETATGMLVVFSTYATTDWLTRGAMAEFCGMAGITWLLAWCITLLRQGRFRLWLGPLMAGICYAHAAIGLFCVVPLVLASGLAAWHWRGMALSWLRPMAISIGITVCLLAPVAVASRPYARLSSLTLLSRRAALMENHLPFVRLFHEPVWYWGNAPFALTVQIDPALLALGLVSVPVFVRTPQMRLVGVFLLGLAGIMLTLQTAWALPFYDMVPVARWIQFTFRLLVFVVVALALCGAAALNALSARAGAKRVWLAVAVLTLAMSVGKPWLGHAPGQLYYDNTQILRAIDNEANAPESYEYTPMPFEANLHALVQGEALPPGTPCPGLPLDDMKQERREARFAVSCHDSVPAILPIGLAPGMRFLVDGKQAAAFRACPDGHARLAIAGKAIVTVIYPDWWRAIAAALSRQPDPALAC